MAQGRFYHSGNERRERAVMQLPVHRPWRRRGARSTGRGAQCCQARPSTDSTGLTQPLSPQSSGRRERDCRAHSGVSSRQMLGKTPSPFRFREVNSITERGRERETGGGGGEEGPQEETAFQMPES